MAAVTTLSDFRAQEEICHCFQNFPFCLPWNDRARCYDLSFLIFIKPAFSLSSFTHIKRFFSSSSLSAIRVVSSVYWRLLIFLPSVLIPACNSSSPALVKKAKLFSVETLQIAEERRESKSNGEREIYTQLNTEFQRVARRDKKAFFNEQWKEIEENDRKGKIGDLFKKTGTIKGTFHPKIGIIQHRNLKHNRSRRDQEEMERIHNSIKTCARTHTLIQT